MKVATQRAYLARAVAGVLTQGCRAYSGNSCKYRAIGGADGVRLACAIGQLISDDVYTDRLEGADLSVAVQAVYESNPDLVEADDGADVGHNAQRFFGKLQSCHDDCTDNKTFVTDFLEKACALGRLIEAGEYTSTVKKKLSANYYWTFKQEAKDADADGEYGKRISAITNLATSMADRLTSDEAREKLFEMVKLEINEMSEGPY